MIENPTYRARVLSVIFGLIERDAKERETDSRNSGSANDNGASGLRDQVKFYHLGMQNGFPYDWEEYRKTAEKLIKQHDDHQDPEYAEYERLKKKFTDK